MFCVCLWCSEVAVAFVLTLLQWHGMQKQLEIFSHHCLTVFNTLNLQCQTLTLYWMYKASGVVTGVSAMFTKQHWRGNLFILFQIFYLHLLMLSMSISLSFCLFLCLGHVHCVYIYSVPQGQRVRHLCKLIVAIIDFCLWIPLFKAVSPQLLQCLQAPVSLVLFFLYIYI